MFSRSLAAAVVQRLPLPTAWFFGGELFHSIRDFVVLLHFPSIDLRQSFFYLAHKPLVVTNQSFHRFMDQRRAISPLLRGDAVQLGLQFGAKFHFHVASVKAASNPVKAFASRPMDCGQESEQSYPSTALTPCSTFPPRA